ncbi:unnamed protein product, partial [Pylaiella littoralis]
RGHLTSAFSCTRVLFNTWYFVSVLVPLKKMKDTGGDGHFSPPGYFFERVFGLCRDVSYETCENVFSNSPASALNGSWEMTQGRLELDLYSPAKVTVLVAWVADCQYLYTLPNKERPPSTHTVTIKLAA